MSSTISRSVYARLHPRPELVVEAVVVERVPLGVLGGEPGAVVEVASVVRQSVTASAKPSSTVAPSRSVRQSWQKRQPLIWAIRSRAASNSRSPRVVCS